MKDFLLLTKTLLKHTFKADKSQGRSKGMLAAYIILAACALPLLVLIAVAVFSLGSIVGRADGEGVLTVLITVCQFVVAIFGIPVILNSIYFSKDSEMLLALPFKASTVFCAKFFIAFFIEFATSAVLLLVAVVPFALGAGVFSIALLLSFVIVPLLPMLLAALIAIPLMYVVSFFKSKGVITSILFVALFGFFFLAYYYLMMQLQFSAGAIFENLDEMIKGLLPAFDGFARIMFPNKFLATSILNSDFGTAALNFVYVLGINAALLAISVFVSSLVYRRSVSKQLENVKSQSGKQIEFASRGKIRTLISKDIKEIVRYPSLAFQCLMQLVFAPVMVFVFGFMPSSMPAEEGMEAAFSWAELLSENVSLTALIILCMFTFIIFAMNYTSSTAISRENFNFYILKILPIPYKQMLEAKVILGFAVNEISLVVSLIVTAILLQPPVLSLLLVFAALSILGYAFSCFQVLMDLMKPRLKWDNPSRGLKNAFSVYAGMLLSLGVIVVLAVLYLALTLISATVGQYVFWAVAFLALVAAAWLSRLALMKNADRRMEAIES